MLQRELRRLIYEIGATLGIEALVWSMHVAGISRREAVGALLTVH